MKIRRLSDVFTAENKDISEYQQLKQAQDPLVQKTTQDAEAVRVAADFGRGSTEEVGRAEKVARIKEQVAKGEYKPDSAVVAAAFVKDLML